MIAAMEIFATKTTTVPMDAVVTTVSADIPLNVMVITTSHGFGGRFPPSSYAFASCQS